MDIERERLRDAYAVYHRQHAFAVGDLVREKDGIRIGSQQRQPNNAYVVMNVCPDPVVCWDPTKSEVYGLRLDIYLGFYDEDGDFLFTWSDSRRFEPLPE